MRAPDPAGLSHRMSTMQDTTSTNPASVVLPLAGNYNPRAQLANWRSLAWSAVLPNLDMGSLSCLAGRTPTSDKSHNRHFAASPPFLPALEGCEILQRNGRLWLTECSNGIFLLDAAHYSMLLAACCGQAEQAPTVQFLVRLSESCKAQQDADQRHFVHWIRHLLVDIK